jgi:RNA polymerase sigma-70 factor (ECF subfamily)
MSGAKPMTKPRHLRDDAQDPEDRILVARSVEGDRQAFEQLYRRHAARVHGLCLRLTADQVEAEILTQDTFVRAWSALAGFTGDGSLGGWLGRVAVNLWRDRLRRDKRSGRLSEQLATEAKAAVPSPATGHRDDGVVVDLLTVMDLERAVARLPRGARTVYVLHDVEGYTHREIGEMAGIATGTVKAHLHRARRLLRTMLDEGKEAAHGA